MDGKQIKELLGLALLGEGIMGLFFPKKYSLLWKIGPKPVRELMDSAADNPEMMRLLYAAEAGLGFWLAKKQVEDEQRERKLKNR